MDGSITHPEIQRLSFDVGPGAGDRARIGLLVLESDQTMEDEFRVLTNVPGVSVYHARLANDAQVTPETLRRMERELPGTARLLPDYLSITSLGYGCTSASTIIGEPRLEEIFDEVHPGVPSTNPLTAAKAALKAMGVERMALLTPYTPDVTAAMQQKFEDAGLSVSVVGSFYEDSDKVVGRIEPASILEATIALGERDDCDAVFISCTSLRAAGIIETAEEKLNKPVTSSNHALAWHLLRLAGIDDQVDGLGRLYKTAL